MLQHSKRSLVIQSCADCLPRERQHSDSIKNIGLLEMMKFVGLKTAWMASREDATLKLLHWPRKMKRRSLRQSSLEPSYKMSCSNLELEKLTTVTRRLLKMAVFHSHCLTCRVRRFQQLEIIRTISSFWRVTPREYCHLLPSLMMSRLHLCSCQATQPRLVEQHWIWRCLNRHSQPALVRYSCPWTLLSMQKCSMKSWRSTSRKYGLSIQGKNSVIQLD